MTLQSSIIILHSNAPTAAQPKAYWHPVAQSEVYWHPVAQSEVYWHPVGQPEAYWHPEAQSPTGLIMHSF